MVKHRQLDPEEQAVLAAFFALLNDDDLARLGTELNNVTNAPNWWFRDQVSAALQQRHES